MIARASIRPGWSVAICVAALGSLLTGASLHGASISPAADAPQPLSPEESQKRFQLPDDLVIELVAAEPLIADPTAICWDERGRLYVCELHGYNLEGQIEIEELNKTGELDTQVRRIQAPEWAKKAAEAGTYGTVKLLEDTDGDGRMDKATVMADRLPPCYGLVPSRGGLIVACAPDIMFLKDADGDGKAEIREKLFTGFKTGNLERGINNPRWGIDNWIYVSGSYGGTITGPNLKEAVTLGGTDFRIKADGSAIEPVTGRTHTFGMTMDDVGQRWLITTSLHALYAAPLPWRYLKRNPFVPTPETVINAASSETLYPISKPHPWRFKRGQDPEWIKFYGARETTPNGSFTSGSGQLIYRDRELPERFWGNHFCCDPQQSLVHRSLLERDGAGWKESRAPEEQSSEFLASTDGWFRPINLLTGPDGAIYVVDMYREIIEDYSAIPRFLQQQYGLTKGIDRGRIWRVQTKSKPREMGTEWRFSFHKEHLRHPAIDWWRESAQRLLIEEGDQFIGALLREEFASPLSAVRLLYAMESLGALQPGDVLIALNRAEAGIRVHGLRLGDRWIDSDEELRKKTLSMVDDPDPSVRLQLAMSLGESRRPEAVGALANLAIRYGDERWMDAAILSSVSERSSELLDELLRTQDSNAKAKRLLRPLGRMLGVRNRSEEMGRLLVLLAGVSKKSDTISSVESVLSGFLAGLSNKQGKLELPEDAREAFQTLLGSDSPGVRAQMLSLAGRWSLMDSPLVQTAFDQAAADAANPALPDSARVAAIRLLSNGPFESFRKNAARFMTPDESVEVQQTVIEAAGALNNAGVAKLLLDGWSGYSPRLRDEAMDAVFRQSERLPELLDAIEKGVINRALVSPLRRLQLLEHGDARIRARAKELFVESKGGDVGVDLEPYVSLLGKSFDLEAGRTLFQTHCQACHEFDGVGASVGPSLTAERNRAGTTFLQDILRPNGQISAGYAAYLVTTKDGSEYTGVMASESATSITLKQANAVEQVLLRRDIASLRTANLSIMPANFAELLTPDQAADLINFLKQGADSISRDRVVLFEDEAEFLEKLADGSGKTSLIEDNAFSGRYAIHLTPFQSHAVRIPGWTYPIRERPKPGEFRFLRLAWKAPKAKGVLVELADNGRWPPAKKATRRYYSGENMTDWAALEISEVLPREWATVTIDLWKDNGDMKLTGIALSALKGDAYFDRIELLRSLRDVSYKESSK